MLLLMRRKLRTIWHLLSETQNLNVIVQNEPLSETNGAEAQMDTSQTRRWSMPRGCGGGHPPCLGTRHMELPVGDFIKDALANEVPVQRKSYLHRTSLTKRTMIWLSVILPKPTVWMKKLRRKRSALEMHGLHIRITQSPKRWLPSVQFSSFSYPYFALTVMLVCAPAQLTSAEMSKFTSRLIASSAKNSDSNGLPVWTSLEKLL